MSNLYKGPHKDDSYHVSVHLAKRLQRRLFRTTLANESKHGRKHLWKVIYKDCSFSSDMFIKHGRQVAMFVNRLEVNEQSL
jgi:hypothetical protein